MNASEESFLNQQFEIKHKLSILNPSVKKPKCKNDVQLAMEQMDEINKTGFYRWIKTESNVSYLCSFKGPLILEYIDADPKSAMYALEWLIEGWSVESVAELVLKLFYSCNISSAKFSERLFAMINSWDNSEIAALIPILLIGESISVCSSFFSHWYLITGWEVDRMTDLVIPLVDGLKWDSQNLLDFLLDTVYFLVDDVVVQKSMMTVIKDEMNSVEKSAEYVLNRFELLYCIVLSERNRVSGMDEIKLEKQMEDIILREE